MPIVRIDMIAGRDAETIKHCLQEVARTVHRTLGAPLNSIRVIANELPATHWAIGDKTRDEIDAEKAAIAASGA
ncbi:tautomerase family protein [Cupriavidus sp. WS]|uniref:tautomerase family protein n=1 Tax=Cupriavidus sp. WS TaxID=1312922 RepID=UPI00036E6FB6|nr:tautomerase family protein [Cupriavidus sp. WS]